LGALLQAVTLIRPGEGATMRIAHCAMPTLIAKSGDQNGAPDCELRFGGKDEG